MGGGGKENERVVGGFEVQRRRNRGGPVQPARKRRGTNGHRGVASSSACQPALPEMLTVPREINATGERLCVFGGLVYRYRDFAFRSEDRRLSSRDRVFVVFFLF